MVLDNNPYSPEQRVCCRLHLGWNDDTVTYRFRHDVPHSIREHFLSWLDSNSPIGRDSPTGLHELSDMFGVSTDKLGVGPAFYAATDPPSGGSPIAIHEANEHYLKDDYLQEGEIGFVQPCYAVVVDDHAISVCVTVRRASHSVEAGVDTEPESRGKGYAGQVTAAWISAARSEGLIPFYSTESENHASQRVAVKLGLIQFAWELGIR